MTAPAHEGSLAEAGYLATCQVVPTHPLPGADTGFTYSIPPGMEVSAGDLVLMDLRGKVRKGLVLARDVPAPAGVALKPLLAVYPGGPLMTSRQLALASWLAAFYHCSLFSALHLNFWDLKFFRTQVVWRIVDPLLAAEALASRGLRPAVDRDALELFRGQVCSSQQLAPFWKALALFGTEPDEALNLLLAVGALAPDYHLRTIKRHPIEPAYRGASEVSREQCTAAEWALWQQLLHWTPPWHWGQLRDHLGVRQRTTWLRLVRKGLLEPLIPIAKSGHGPQHVLNLQQQDVLEAILPDIGQGDAKIHLLQGITGSGKTEIYLRTAEHALPYGVVLFLVPEIALTHQTVQRVTAYFGETAVALLHSGQTDSERRGVWEAIRRGEVRVLIGPRSALFAPADRISLIILDEEHDQAYKQHATPRYHARTVAQKLAELHGAVVILGSATPSLESWHAAQRLGVAHHVLPERAGAAVLPTVRIVELHPSAMRGGEPALSAELHGLLDDTLQRGKQGLLFLNQRGFAKALQCLSCRWIPRCPRCAIALTVHRRDRKLVCHHCDFTRAIPGKCDQCHREELAILGFGTQQVEALVQQYWPGARVARLDRDITQQRGAMERVLERFALGEIDLLVGTQMVAKGLDIPGLEAVGVLLADQGLTLPDFRASERTFQLLTQVAGRAGRRETPGQVIIQAFDTEHPVLHQAASQDYASFATEEMLLRRLLHYPPFCRLIRLLFEAPQAKMALDVAADAVRTLTALAGNRLEAEGPDRLVLLGPAPAPLERLRNQHRVHVLLKVPQVGQGIALIRAWESERRKWWPREVRVTVDVDPVDLL